MKSQYRLWIILIVGVILVLLLWATVSAPGWSMPDQSGVRQTVPTRTPAPVLEPRAYLPIILKGISP
jgi:hypothetical protein